MILRPEQCRAARALLSMTQANLAEAAEAGSKTIADFERGAKRELHAITLRALRQALESKGIDFLDTEGKSPGVRLKKRPKGMALNKAKRVITPLQCKAARAFLYISQTQLAEAAGLALMSVADFERGIDRDFNEATLKAIHDALKKAGIIFIDANGGGPGVRSRE